MAGKIITNATYVSGDTNIGHKRIKVSLVADPIYLTVRQRSDGRDLISIPWPNLEYLQNGSADKSTGGKLTAWTAGLIPGLDITRMSYSFDWGFKIVYKDEAVQRNQAPFFAVGGSLDKCDKLRFTIMEYRDGYVRGIGRKAGPDRR